jgi:hypothetical protein
MKLYIDDIRTSPDDSWNICRTTLSAISALDMFWEQITHIALDHDISHQIVMGEMSRPFACPETFEVVARYIATLKKLHPEWQPIIRIHTSNPVGAERMKGILKAVDIVPTIQLARGANRLETIL